MESPTEEKATLPKTIAPRSGLLLFFAAAFLAASIDELALRWTGAFAPREVNIVLLIALAFLAWAGRRLPWKWSIGALVVAISVLAYAALWP